MEEVTDISASDGRSIVVDGAWKGLTTCFDREFSDTFEASLVPLVRIKMNLPQFFLLDFQCSHEYNR